MKLIIACLLIINYSVIAETITLREYLYEVCISHPLFISESLKVEIKATNTDRYLGNQDWIISSAPYYLHQEPVMSGIGVPEEVDIVEGDVTIEKPFWRTGGRLSLSWVSSYTDQTVNDIVIPLLQDTIVMSAGPSTFYAHKLYVTYTQPLLQNFGGTIDRLNYDMSIYTLDMTALQAQENKEVFLLEVSGKFLDWVLINEQNRIAHDRLELARDQQRQVERKYNANLVDKVDVLRAENAVRSVQQSIVLLESQNKALQTELAILSKTPSLYDFKPGFNLYELVALPPVDQAIAKLFEKSVVLKAMHRQKEQLEYLHQRHDEMTNPKLFLTFGAGLHGGSEVFDESFELSKPDALVAISFRYPLGARRAHADMLRTKLEIDRLDKQIEEVILTYEAAVRNLLQLIEDMKKVLELNREQIRAAKAKTTEELRLYNQGRNVLALVIQSRDDEQQANYTYAKNSAEYHRLILQYHALMDELLGEYGGR